MAALGRRDRGAGPYLSTATPTPQSLSSVTPAAWNHRIFLPSILNNFPTYLTYGRKGIGDAWQNWATPTPFLGTTPTPGPTPTRGANLSVLDFGWYYDWTFYYLPERGQDLRYVRMVWCDETTGTDINGVTHSITDIARMDYNTGQRGRVWLIYNEPERHGQCGDRYALGPSGDTTMVIEAARHFSVVYDMIKAGDPYARVFGGGLAWLNTAEVQLWWSTFIATLRTDGVLYKLEGVHIHLYPYVSTSTDFYSTGGCATQECAAESALAANNWFQQQHVGLGLGDRPIWITEMGWLWDPTIQRGCYNMSKDWIRDNFMIPISQWFARDAAWPYSAQADVNPGYSAVAWYVTWDDPYPCTHLLNGLGPSGASTVLGTSWNSFRP